MNKRMLPRLRFSQNDTSHSEAPEVMVKLPSASSTPEEDSRAGSQGFLKTALDRIKLMINPSSASEASTPQVVSQPSLPRSKRAPTPRPLSSSSVLRDLSTAPRSRVLKPSSEGFAELASKSSDSKFRLSNTSVISSVHNFQQEELKVKPHKPAHFVISPSSQAKLWWDILVIVITIVNGFILPYKWAFCGSQLTWFNILLRTIYLADAVLALRTVVILESGQKVEHPKQIFLNRIKTSGFFLDILAFLPISEVLSVGTAQPWFGFQLATLIKYFRLRWSTIVQKYEQQWPRLLQFFILLLLYIHFTACLHYKVVERLQIWEPSSYTSSNGKFYLAPVEIRYLESFYAAMMALTGNEINPEGGIHIAVASTLTISGALIMAKLLGEAAAISTARNRKHQAFQEKVDLANSTMRNIKLPQELKDEVVEFMIKTESNLEGQQQLDNLMSFVSPSIRSRITKLIFRNSVSRIPVLKESLWAISHLISDIEIQLCQPEEKIVQQGQEGDKFFLIERGECEVWVRTQKKEEIFVRTLEQGDYFGEISVINGVPCTATVKASNYCTLAVISRKTLFEMGQCAPEIVKKLKAQTMAYNDPWKQFKIKQLQRISFLNQVEPNDDLLNELSSRMVDEYKDKGQLICRIGEISDSIWFLVDGVVELNAQGENGVEYFDSLRPGDIIAPSSYLFKQKMHFSAAVVNSQARFLRLDGSIFLNMYCSDAGDQLHAAVKDLEDNQEKYGYSPCDYVKIARVSETLQTKLRRSSLKAKLFLTPKNSKPKSAFATNCFDNSSVSSRSYTSSKLSGQIRPLSPPKDILDIPHQKKDRRSSVISALFPKRPSISGIKTMALKKRPQEIPSITAVPGEPSPLRQVSPLFPRKELGFQKIKSSMQSPLPRIQQCFSQKKYSSRGSVSIKKQGDFGNNSPNIESSQNSYSMISMVSPQTRRMVPVRRDHSCINSIIKLELTSPLSSERPSAEETFSGLVDSMNQKASPKKITMKPSPSKKSSNDKAQPTLSSGKKDSMTPMSLSRFIPDPQMYTLEENLAEEMNSESQSCNSFSSPPCFNFYLKKPNESKSLSASSTSTNNNLKF